jgi:hypothetical protein
MAGLAFASGPAQAGVFSDDLTKCVVASATADDRNALMQWLFAAMAANQAIEPMAKVSQEQRDGLNRKFTDITERLLLADCHSQTLTAVRNEGAGVIEAAFRVLGEVAIRGLMSDPATTKSFSAVDQYSNKAKWEAFAKEAGIPLQQGK